MSVVEKERKKAEKAKKFTEKKAKTAEKSSTSAPSASKDKKSKHESAKEEPLPEYFEETPPGEKKSMLAALINLQKKFNFFTST